MVPSDRRANILISVLWIIIALVIIVLGLTYEARSDIERTILLRDRAQAYWLARGAVERVKFDYAVTRLQNLPDEEQTNQLNFEFETGTAKCVLMSNSSKMSVNTTDRALWEQLFTFYGFEDQQKEETIDAILDWRDEDDLKRLNGAENEHYEALVPPYLPRNGPFHSIEELLLVRGITEDLFYGFAREGNTLPGLQEVLTANGPIINRFDINSCPKPILMAFLEIEEQDANAIIQAREEKLFQTMEEALQNIPPVSAEKFNRFFMTYRGNQFTIKATGFAANSAARYTVEDEVRYTGGRKLYLNLSHKDFSLDHADEAVAEEEETQ